MANVFARFILFLSSYVPLWVIFAIITLRTMRNVSLGFMGFSYSMVRKATSASPENR